MSAALVVNLEVGAEQITKSLCLVLLNQGGRHRKLKGKFKSRSLRSSGLCSHVSAGEGVNSFISPD